MGADIYSPEQVSTHNDPADLWITIDQEVYDLSNFIEEHPGGANSVFKVRLSYLVVFYSLSLVLLTVAGKDASKLFYRYHRKAILNRFKDRLCVGVLGRSAKSVIAKRFFFGIQIGALSNGGARR
jgi:cytochrome b involved in lipid metabolism